MGLCVSLPLLTIRIHWQFILVLSIRQESLEYLSSYPHNKDLFYKLNATEVVNANMTGSQSTRRQRSFVSNQEGI